MFHYHYSICGLQILLQAEAPLTLGDESCPFEADPAPADVCVTLKKAEEIPTPSGTPCNSHIEHPSYREDRQISRCSWDRFRKQPHFRTDYDLNSPNHRHCFVRTEDWAWATRGKYLWPDMMLNTLLLHNQGAILHASYIGYKGSGIIFTASSGVGKSTQAELWRKHRGAVVLNGDKVGIRLLDTPTAYGVPFSGTSGICENASLPIKAIVVLSQAPTSTVSRLSPSKAVQALFPNIYVDQAVPEEWQLALYLLLELTQRVPVLALACTPDEASVRALEEALSL